MKNLLYVFAASLLLLINSCGPKDPGFSGVKVHTFTHLIGGQVDIYTYDTQTGNVAMIEHSTGDKTYYTYTGDTILMQYIIGGTVVANGTQYVLGGDKYVDTAAGLYQSQNNSASFLYAPNGQMWQTKNYGHGTLQSTLTYLINNKNPTILTVNDASTGNITRTFYDYSTITNTIGNQNFGMGFLGVGSVYMPNKKVTLDGNNDTLGVVYYRYRLNSSGIDTLATYDRTGHIIDSLAYSYY